MKAIKVQTAKGYYVGTIRKANYVEEYFGKVTDWGTKYNYEAGPFHGIKTITWINLHLEDDRQEAENILRCMMEKDMD